MGDPTDPTSFRQVLGQYPTGVCAVTAIEPGGAPAGFVVGSFTSVSLAPPLVAFLPAKSSTSWPRIERAKRFCVNILSAEHEELCRRFAEKNVDRFDGVRWRPAAASGAPIIEGVVAWIDCELEGITEAGDHFVVLGRVLDLDIERPALPLLFFQGGYGRFTPLSLTAANLQGTLTEQLRQVDIVRAEMERLAAALSARCIATARTAEGLAVTASAGATNTSAAATLVGQVLPFVQPTGSIFAASMQPAELDAYLDAIRDERSRQRERERIGLVRERGFSVGLMTEAQRASASMLDRLAEDPEAISHEDLRRLIEELAYDPVELTPEAKTDVKTISVPVRGPDGAVALALTLYGFPKPDDAPRVDAHIERCLAASRRASELLGGAGGDPS